MKKEKSCGAIIFNDNKVLIIKSKKGYYGFPKGHMETGESEIETAIREVKEETNLNIKINDVKRYSISYIIKEDIEKEVVYFIGIAKDFDINPQIEEVSEIMWVNVEEVETLLQFDNIKELWRGVLRLYRNGEFYG